MDTATVLKKKIKGKGGGSGAEDGSTGRREEEGGEGAMSTQTNGGLMRGGGRGDLEGGMEGAGKVVSSLNTFTKQTNVVDVDKHM